MVEAAATGEMPAAGEIPVVTSVEDVSADKSFIPNLPNPLGSFSGLRFTLDTTQLSLLLSSQSKQLRLVTNGLKSLAKCREDDRVRVYL